MEQLDARLGFLRDVGLGYLTLDRQTRTLSGGEAQRISLANALGSRLVDTLYVLDEPSVGLHPRDTDRLLGAAPPPARRRQHGASSSSTTSPPSAQADFMLELGPGSRRARRPRGPRRSGRDGATSSLTGQYLTGAEADRGAERAAAGRAALAPDPRRHAAQPARAWTPTSRSARSPRSPA